MARAQRWAAASLARQKPRWRNRVSASFHVNPQHRRSLRHISRRATAVTFGSCCRAVARAFIRATRLDSHLRHPCNAGRHAPENNDKPYGETAMFRQNRIGLALGLTAAALLLGTPSGALAQG